MFVSVSQTTERAAKPTEAWHWCWHGAYRPVDAGLPQVSTVCCVICAASYVAQFDNSLDFYVCGSNGEKTHSFSEPWELIRTSVICSYRWGLMGERLLLPMVQVNHRLTCLPETSAVHLWLSEFGRWRPEPTISPHYTHALTLKLVQLLVGLRCQWLHLWCFSVDTVKCDELFNF